MAVIKHRTGKPEPYQDLVPTKEEKENINKCLGRLDAAEFRKWRKKREVRG